MDAFIPDTLGEGALVAGTAGFGLFARTVAKGVGGILRNADECFDAAKVSDDVIMPYNEAKKLTKGKKGELQALELFEFRHQKSNGLPRQARKTVPTRVLSREEHQEMTNILREKMKYRHDYDIDRVMSDYNYVYSAQEYDSISTWLRGLGF